MTEAAYIYWKMKRRKAWATPYTWYAQRARRFELWKPAKPTKPIKDIYDNVIIDVKNKDEADVAMCWFLDARKVWKIPNTATKTIVWRNIGWL